MVVPPIPSLRGVKRVKYGFISQSDGTLTVTEGSLVYLIDEDLLNGWSKVQIHVPLALWTVLSDEANQKDRGMVPSSYIEDARVLQQGRALHDYEASSDLGTIPLTRGDAVAVYLKENGWILVDVFNRSRGSRIGYVPASYVETCSASTQVSQMEDLPPPLPPKKRGTSLFKFSRAHEAHGPAKYQSNVSIGQREETVDRQTGDWVSVKRSLELKVEEERSLREKQEIAANQERHEKERLWAELDSQKDKIRSLIEQIEDIERVTMLSQKEDAIAKAEYEKLLNITSKRLSEESERAKLAEEGSRTEARKAMLAEEKWGKAVEENERLLLERDKLLSHLQPALSKRIELECALATMLSDLENTRRELSEKVEELEDRSKRILELENNDQERRSIVGDAIRLLTGSLNHGEGFGDLLDQGSHIGPFSNATRMAQSEEGRCAICLEERSNTVLINCGHLCVCGECGAELFQASPHVRCPVCRISVTSMVRVYRV